MGRRSDHTREEIKEMAIKAGTKLIDEKGLKNCSARKIAAKIGYSVGTLYNVFENYDDLVLHINAVTIDDMHNYFEKNLDRDLEGVDALKLMAACYMQFAYENDSRWRALFEHFRPVDFDIPEWYLQKVSRLFSIPEELILPLVKGDIKNAQRVANVLWGGVHGIYSLGLTVRMRQSGTEYLKTMSNSLIENYLRGLTKAKE